MDFIREELLRQRQILAALLLGSQRSQTASESPMAPNTPATVRDALDFYTAPSTDAAFDDPRYTLHIPAAFAADFDGERIPMMETFRRDAVLRRLAADGAPEVERASLSRPAPDAVPPRRFAPDAGMDAETLEAFYEEARRQSMEVGGQVRARLSGGSPPDGPRSRSQASDGPSEGSMGTAALSQVLPAGTAAPHLVTEFVEMPAAVDSPQTFSRIFQRDARRYDGGFSMF